MSEKIGFWSVFALVVGSQIGSGIFVLPSALAPFGIFSLIGWVISGFGALCLALVFAGLCHRFPKTGGPHVYVKTAFGNTTSFFTGWTYWTISWVSTTAVIVTSIGYLSPFIGSQEPWVYLSLEISLLLIITALNLKGIKTAGEAEFLLTLMKVLPLLILPTFALFHFNSANIQTESSLRHASDINNIAQATLLTLWCFIGLECATTPAGSVENPSKTIPKAIVLGTITTALLYLFNHLTLAGLIPEAQLASSKAPYLLATQYLFSGNWYLIISMISSIICIGTLNAWILTSGQIALGLAEDGLMPQAFARTNEAGAPTVSLLMSACGILPFLCLTLSQSMTEQITSIINFSVITFLFIYLICVLSYLKTLKETKAAYYHWIYTLAALLFCLWILYETPLINLAIASLFIATGLPLYLLWYKHKLKTPAQECT